MVTPEPGPTPAAGGIIIRRDDGVSLVLIIHRPLYDDWTLPKGHVDRGESDEDAARREVFEETGFACRLGDEVATVQYVTRDGVRKRVRYWLMEPIEGRFTPNDEVDEVRWLPVGEAVSLLSYDLDRTLVRSALSAT